MSRRIMPFTMSATAPDPAWTKLSPAQIIADIKSVADELKAVEERDLQAQMQFKTVAMQILEAEVARKIKSEIDEAKMLMLGTGADLDILGDKYKFPRRAGESDQAYRLRMIHGDRYNPIKMERT